MNRIITIGREFGSGGRELGLRLSQRLGIAYYDQEIISEISRRTELSEQYVKKMAEKSDCVIVGRCADDILREMNPLRIFVYGDMETKLERCRKRTGSDEKMTDREILSNIRKIDKNRSEYYGLYTGKVWGDKQSYDLCINTSKISVERAAELLAEFVR